LTYKINPLQHIIAYIFPLTNHSNQQITRSTNQQQRGISIGFPNYFRQNTGTIWYMETVLLQLAIYRFNWVCTARYK